MVGAKMCWSVFARSPVLVCLALSSPPAVASAQLEAGAADAPAGQAMLDFSIRVPPLLTLRAAASEHSGRAAPRMPGAGHIAVDGFEVSGNAGTLSVARVLVTRSSKQSDRELHRLLIAAMP